MNAISDLNSAVSYIERNLENNVDIKEVAKVADMSIFHFMRMFSALSGVGVYEYIRKRRMTKAVEELQNTNIKVIDLGLKYGYESPTVFNKAFKDIHGVSPSKARKEKISLKSYLPISFIVTVKGVEEMEYYIEEISGFRAVGFKRSYNYTNGENFENIPKFWQEVMQNGDFNQVMSLMNAEPFGPMGICGNMVDSVFDYYIAVSSSNEVPVGMDEIFIETQSYAIFTCKIPEIQDITKRIFSEWLPNSEYVHAENAAELEIYAEDDSCRICIPIAKAK